MKIKFIIFLFAVFSLTGCLSGAKPDLTGITPTIVYPRQIVAVQGNDLDFAYVQWDAGVQPQKFADNSLLNAKYFQIPADATPGVHNVRLSNYWGISSNTIALTVNPSISWPGPRIEDITYRLVEMNNATQTMKLLFYISAANVDAKATVQIGSSVAESALYSAIPSDYFVSHPKTDSYGYPVFDYGQLLASYSFTPVATGSSVDLKITNTDGKSSAIFSLKLPTSVATLDSDGDGLLDDWEINGYPRPSNPTTKIDLKAMGCDPYKKDVLVEVDWMKTNPLEFRGYVPKPNDAIWDEIASVYKNAPVLNPDGSQGIHVIIDRGQDRPAGLMNQGGDEVDFHSSTDIEKPPPGIMLPTDYISFFDLKTAFFKDADRKQIFHYCIFAYRNPGQDSGVGEIWGNDFLITLTDVNDDYGIPIGGNDITQVGAFVHELGHNLGLRHGGIDNNAQDADSNYKPNLLSTMNYRYQRLGIPLGCDFAVSGNVQGYSAGMLKAINETNVNEFKGICDELKLDLDGNTRISSSGAKDVNDDNDKTEILYDYDQWGNLKLNAWDPLSRWNKN